MLDQMAHRYSVLPSELIRKGTTQDIAVFDVAMSYEQYLNQKRNRANKQPIGPQPASPELTERLAEFKRKNNENKG